MSQRQNVDESMLFFFKKKKKNTRELVEKKALVISIRMSNCSIKNCFDFFVVDKMLSKKSIWFTLELTANTFRCALFQPLEMK